MPQTILEVAFVRNDIQTCFPTCFCVKYRFVHGKQLNERFLKKNVKYAYHLLCTECASTHMICAKCTKSKEIVEEPDLPDSDKQREENQLKEELKHMRLREKRTYLRQRERGIDVPLPSRDASESDDDFDDDESCSDDDDDDDDATTDKATNCNNIKRTEKVAIKGVT